MDPLSLGLSVVGFGMQLFGGFSQADNARQQAAVSQDIAVQEQGINAQKQQQMQLQAQRAKLENFRNVQRAKSMGLATATSQGAEFGSGLQGGQAQATDAGVYNDLGINQNLQIGQNIFGYNSKISSDKQQLASLGGEAATDQGIASLGGALIKSGPTIGQLGKGLGSLFPGTGFAGPYI
jgi:hypothetical protein